MCDCKECDGCGVEENSIILIDENGKEESYIVVDSCNYEGSDYILVSLDPHAENPEDMVLKVNGITGEDGLFTEGTEFKSLDSQELIDTIIKFMAGKEVDA